MIGIPVYIAEKLIIQGQLAYYMLAVGPLHCSGNHGMVVVVSQGATQLHWFVWLVVTFVIR